MYILYMLYILYKYLGIYVCLHMYMQELYVEKNYQILIKEMQTYINGAEYLFED